MIKVAGFIGLLLFAASQSLAAAPLLSLDGEFKQGAIVRGKAAPGSVIEFNGETVPVGEAGEFVVGLGRDATAEATLVIRTQDEQWQKTYAVARRQYNIQNIEGVPQKTVTPSEAQLARARKEAEKVWKARQTERAATDYSVDFKWPLLGPITGVYGSQRVYNGDPGRPHYGVDIARPTGTPVVAPAPGEVTLAEPDLFYSGGTLIIDHGHGLSSTFIHLSRLHVGVGDKVRQSEVIGEVGASGRATGAHLDWRMNWRGERVDPTTLVGPMPEAQ